MKYRVVEKTKASGFKLWIVQKKVLWWWDYVDSYMEEGKALFVLNKLKSGTPEETSRVIHETD